MDILKRWRGDKHAAAREPGAALFHGLRVRLTLWYCGVLGAALVLFSVALYLGVNYLLLNPVQDDAMNHAHAHVGQWMSGSPDFACTSDNRTAGKNGPPPNQGPNLYEMIACYDQNGVLLASADTPQLPQGFLANNLAKTALRIGQPVQDTVNAGGSIGHIYRYALVVPNANRHGDAGVIVIGESIETQERSLEILLLLLCIVGGASLLGAGFGGLFLASRAIAPAHVAFTRQQRFIADASHELRTPLTLMRADAEVLLRGRKHLPAEDAALLEDIVAEADHMSKLANSMLTLARLDTNAQHREYEVVDLAALAKKNVHRVTAFAEEKGVVVRLETQNTAFVIGDSMLLEQVVLILLDNAIKYNRTSGSVTVSTSVEHGMARLEVHDTGVGIAAEHLAHLGERFYRVDKARSREAGGIGLGLSIAQSIALIHGGTLTLTSVQGEGTTALLLLPLAQGDAKHVSDELKQVSL